MTTEVNTLMRVRDKDGTEYLAYPVTKAANAIFDKETSGISADTVQEALEELDARTPDYSLEEQNTGRKWIDGKRIYCKTVDFGFLSPNSVQDTLMHNISLSCCIKVEGVTFINRFFVPTTWANPIDTESIRAISLAMDEFAFYCYHTKTDEIANYKTVATFYYTKTTD